MALNIRVSAEKEKKFRDEAYKRFGMKRSALKKLLEEIVDKL